MIDANAEVQVNLDNMEAGGLDAAFFIVYTGQATRDARGYAVLPQLLTASDCASIAAMYPDDTRFRSRVVMQRHGFGRGEYQYFAYPLPDAIRVLRARLYERLAPIANRWNEELGNTQRFPVLIATPKKDRRKPQS